MDQDPGIIRVVDPNEEQEDEALVALRALPKFEPLVVPDAPSHFSLTSVFGAFSATADSRGASTELAFNPSVLIDILVQINAHSKRCGQDIQEFQRSLGTKMRALDDFTAGAVQELTAIHQQAKTNSGELLSGICPFPYVRSRFVEAGTDDDDVTTWDSRQTQPHIRRPPRRSRGRRDLRIGIPTPLPQVFCAIGVGAAGPEHNLLKSETYGYYRGNVCDRSWCNDNYRDKSGVPTSALCAITDDSTCNTQGSSQYGAGIEFTQLSFNAVNISIRSGLYIREPNYGCWWWRAVVGESDPPVTERRYCTGF
ncbi:hypothetical protein BGZ89_005320 [Linnemannia elongata]|nr:hypothetical protein BGZ89_005320 [Linnemannia elongata]